MCGIVAVLQRPSARQPPSARDILAALKGAASLVPGRPDGIEGLARAVERVESAERMLRGTAGVRGLLADRASLAVLDSELGRLESVVDRLEASLDRDAVVSGGVESLNASLVRLKDALWSVRRDRVGTALAVAELAGEGAGRAAFDAFTAVQIALAALDRLEVRGRDSAGVHLLVRGHGLDPSSASVRAMVEERSSDPLFRSLSVRVRDGTLGFVYKAAAEIGELGDNVRRLREAIRSDPLLHLALASEDARVSVLGHTRWASVGLISEPNAHPLNGEEEGRGPGPYAEGRGPGPYVVAALNGDVDNYADLKGTERVRVPPEITTDAKIIPVLTSRRMGAGLPLEDAFRAAVGTLDGSVAIAAASASNPGRLLCALRGSGQALYVGLAEDAYVVASEPYGLVEQAGSYLRMDGETPADPSHPAGTRGQVIVLDEDAAGSVDGIRRLSYDGRELPVRADELQTPEITTRDIDRGEHLHFLLKEISEAPRSFRKTLRGKIVDRDGGPDVVLGPEAIPPELARRLRAGEIRRIFVIGQGTAAVAGRSLASYLRDVLTGTPVTVEAMAATELSGFEMREDMSDTLVVAISQSGTTTDTNRTVDLSRSRRAGIVSIVNRRQSDLTDRSDGVLYTSDGRDVEMAVPSTKAFYSQVAAGFVLGAALARELGVGDGAARGELLAALRELPDRMQDVLALRSEIAEIAQRQAPARRYWAVVGNGANRVAAEEVRIKLSELCYKSIACDVTEDKKHIDLSSEPLIVVCAAGLTGSNAEDVAKEVAIYRAHKAAPIVIATEGESAFGAALELVRVPAVHPRLAFVLSAMVGHLFGYEAALAIDAQARPFREARAAIEAATEDGRDAEDVLGRLGRAIRPIAARFFDDLRTGAYNGHLEASTAVRLASLFRYATGAMPLEAYHIEYGKLGTPGLVVEDLADALTQAIDELTRPVDAIKHQAKTVTVGISRAEETILQVRLVREVVGAGASRDRLSYGSLRTLAALDPAVERVVGYTTYRIEGDLASGAATIRVVDKGGISRDLSSRTERDPRLRGTKHRVATEREVLVAVGRADGRPIVIVPEVKGAEVTGMVVLHVMFEDRLPSSTMRRVLEGYRDRSAALRDYVTETEPTFREDLLGELPVIDLLTQPIHVLAERWRQP